MASITQKIEGKYKKKVVAQLRSGDNVRVHQKVREGSKERVQIFEGLVIRTTRSNSLTSSFTVRRIASGIGVEKTFLIHSPGILKIEITKRSKVRRNYITYMRGLRGKGARLTGMEFDKAAVNAAVDEEAEAEEAKIHEEQLESYDPEAAKKEKEQEKAEAEKSRTDMRETLKDEADKIEEKPKERPSAKAPAEEPNKEAKPAKTVDSQS